MSIKGKFNSKEMKEAVSFIANIANSYAIDNSNNYVKVIVGEKGKLIYAHKGVYLEMKMNFTECKEGEFVIEPYFLEELPSRSNETSFEVDKDEDGFKFSFANGKVKGDLVINNEMDAFNRQIMDSSEFPSNFVKLNKSQLANTVNKVLYTSSDNELDKKVGLPVKIVSKGKSAQIYAGDNWCALIYTIELKEKAEKCNILTQGSLLKSTFSVAGDEIQFASNENSTRVKSKKFDLIVPTQELQIFDPESFYEKQGKSKSNVTFNMEEMTNALQDVLIVSKIANIDSKVEVSVKGDKITILNKANVGKSKATVKCKAKGEFTISIYADWLTNFSKNFEGDTKLELYKAAAILKNKDESVVGIIPIIDG